MRTVYLLASYLLMPLFMVHLVWRGLRDRDYLKRWAERFGFYHTRAPADGIVIHAASVGEINAAESLIRGVAKRFPEKTITVTSFTPTGSKRVKALFGEKVFHCYIPFDLPGSVNRFFQSVKPRLLIVMETEIWPWLFIRAGDLDIPIMMANARISEQSFKTYRRLRGITGMALANVTRLAAQSENDAARWIELGIPAERVEVSGNLKFDLSLPDVLQDQGRALRAGWGPARSVFLAGSTHEGDEPVVLNAFRKVLESFPQALLVLVPRHPERFQRAAHRARKAGFKVHIWSQSRVFPPDIQCLVVDAMGELLTFYAACDVAFVGGSLDNTGGHNVLEPAALSKPVLTGPHTHHFADITRQLLSRGGGLCIHNADELAQAVMRLLAEDDSRHKMGAAGQQLVQSGQGALSHSLQIITSLL